MSSCTLSMIISVVMPHVLIDFDAEKKSPNFLKKEIFTKIYILSNGYNASLKKNLMPKSNIFVFVI